LAPVHDILSKHLPELRDTLGVKTCVLEPGDLVYLPCNWYHATVNIGTTVAVGGAVDASAGGDRCARDVYAEAISAITAALPAPGAPVPHALVAAGVAAPYNVECVVKSALVLARRKGGEAAEHAVDWMMRSARRFRELESVGIVAAPLLAVILELFADYFQGLAALLPTGQGAAGRAAVAAIGQLFEWAAAADGGRSNPKIAVGLAQLAIARWKVLHLETQLGSSQREEAVQDAAGNATALLRRAESAVAEVAPGGEFIYASPCIFPQWFSIENMQGRVKNAGCRHRRPLGRGRRAGRRWCLVSDGSVRDWGRGVAAKARRCHGGAGPTGPHL
jgi:hypothetical protein